MAEVLLITNSDIQAYRRIDPNYNADRFNAFLLEAQRTNLRQLLGDELYCDLMDNSTEVKYVELIAGKKQNGKYFFGIKAALVYWWLVIYSREGELFHSGFGAVEFTNNPQQSFEKAKEKERIATGYMEIAQTYANDVIAFLNENSSTYPKWVGKNQENKVNFLTFKV